MFSFHPLLQRDGMRRDLAAPGGNAARDDLHGGATGPDRRHVFFPLFWRVETRRLKNRVGLGGGRGE